MLAGASALAVSTTQLVSTVKSVQRVITALSGFQLMPPMAASLAAVTLSVRMAVNRAQAAVTASRISTETTVRSVQMDTIIFHFAREFPVPLLQFQDQKIR